MPGISPWWIFFELRSSTFVSSLCLLISNDQIINLGFHCYAPWLIGDFKENVFYKFELCLLIYTCVRCDVDECIFSAPMPCLPAAAHTSFHKSQFHPICRQPLAKDWSREYFVYFVIIFWRISVLAYRASALEAFAVTAWFLWTWGETSQRCAGCTQAGGAPSDKWLASNDPRSWNDNFKVILIGMMKRNLLARQPALLPRLRSLRPASRVARLADSLNKFVFILRIWPPCCVI